jgi:uncharacterized membrane protein SpoIIM required for sporulation
MREALFIKRNAEKWQEYQQEPSSDPDEQAERFITLLDDLAYSRTFYPQSKVTRWINNIAASIYQKIYRNKKEQYHRLFTFWTHELPLVFYRNRLALLVTFLFFAISMVMGIYSSATDDSFVKGILGESYVSMTEENIERGDPFGVYRDEDKFTMFMMIAANNIKVAFRAFAFGIFFGIGTLWILFYNGIMVGAFEYMFFAKGLGWQSIMVIWIHGTMEIASIIISGCAGLVIGAGLLFPGTYSRGESFKRGMKDALKIIISMVPFFITAALLESYVTYQMSDRFATVAGAGAGLPLWLGIGILAVSCAIMFGYFVWYPAVVAKRQKNIDALQNQRVLALNPL